MCVVSSMQCSHICVYFVSFCWVFFFFLTDIYSLIKKTKETYKKSLGNVFGWFYLAFYCGIICIQ